MGPTLDPSPPVFLGAQPKPTTAALVHSPTTAPLVHSTKHSTTCFDHDLMSTWASTLGERNPRAGLRHDEVLNIVYGKPPNTDLLAGMPEQNCPGFPWSITDQQLVSVVDPVIRDSTRPLVIIEAGVFWGGTSIRMGERVKAKVPDMPHLQDSVVISIDTWLGDLHMWGDAKWKEGALNPSFLGPSDFVCFTGAVRRSKVQDMIIPIRLPSNMGARLLYHSGILADLIYVDGSHDYQDVMNDLLQFSHLLAPCGILFGDDYHIGDVKAAVNDFASTNHMHVESIFMREHEGARQHGWVLRTCHINN